MRVLVCGGRAFNDKRLVALTLSPLHRDRCFSALIHGAASGADEIGHLWAEFAGVPVERFPAQWGQFGPAAGPIRNRQMLVEGKPDLVVAFPGGRGTANMVAQAREAGVEVIEVKPR